MKLHHQLSHSRCAEPGLLNSTKGIINEMLLLPSQPVSLHSLETKCLQRCNTVGNTGAQSFRTEQHLSGQNEERRRRVRKEERMNHHHCKQPEQNQTTDNPASTRSPRAMEPPAAALDSTPDPAIVQPPGSSPPAPPREQQQHQEQLRIGDSGQFGDGPEDRGLLESSTRLKPHEAQSYRKKALWVSWVSIIVTLALAVAAFTVSVMRYSASSFGFAFDATLDVLSSAIVLWRYSNAAAVHSAHREYIACVILGVIFLLSSICIVIKAIHDLAKKVLPEVDDFLYSVSVLSGILCTVLAVIKFMLGKVLTSRALITDGCLLIWCPVYGKRATTKCLSEDHAPLLCKDCKTTAVLAGGANGILLNMQFVSCGPFLLQVCFNGKSLCKIGICAHCLQFSETAAFFFQICY